MCNGPFEQWEKVKLGKQLIKTTLQEFYHLCEVNDEKKEEFGEGTLTNTFLVDANILINMIHVIHEDKNIIDQISRGFNYSISPSYH